MDARLVQGLHDYIVGSLPWGWRMLGFLVGIHGDKEKGIRTVQDVAENGKLNRVDARNPALRAVPAREPDQTGRAAGAGADPALPAQLPPAPGTRADVQHWPATASTAWRRCGKWRA